MGKPYAEELERFPDVYEWAMRVNVTGLARFVAAARTLPLYAVGSGGSLTAAAFAAMLHRWTFQPATYVTPQMLAWEPSRRECATLLLSASGRNREILDAMRHSAKHPTGIVCASEQNPLVEAAEPETYVHAASPTTGRDGFLATNILLATCVWLARAYGMRVPALGKYEVLWLRMRTGTWGAGWVAGGPDLGISHLLVLADPWGWPAAVDMESKFHESGLAAVQITDWRNFAHGRHHWLAVNGQNTAVVALATPQSADMAARTLEMLPDDVHVVRLGPGTEWGEPYRVPPDGVCTRPRIVHERVAGSLNMLVNVMDFVGGFGSARDIDIGKPKVAEFGRKIHHMNDAPPGA